VFLVLMIAAWLLFKVDQRQNEFESGVSVSNDKKFCYHEVEK
jgi:hypothetical protein